MIYLDKEYLKTHIYERFLIESTSDFEQMLSNSELEWIDIVKSMLSSRYNVVKIFDTNTPIHNELMKRILSKFIIYDAVRRNAARKVPTDFENEKKWAEEMLEKISVGKIVLDDLPKPPEDNTGNNGSFMSGNLSNQDFYI